MSLSPERVAELRRRYATGPGAKDLYFASGGHLAVQQQVDDLGPVFDELEYLQECIARMKEVLRGLEWNVPEADTYGTCPVCGEVMNDGRHAGDCALAAALKEA